MKKNKDVMLTKYVRDFTMDCKDGTQNITNYDSLKQVETTFKSYTNAIVIRNKGKVIIIQDKSINIYEYD